MLTLVVCFHNTQKLNRQHTKFKQTALATLSLHIDHIWITTDQLVRFYENEFNEMRCKLNSTENLRSFEKYQTYLQRRLSQQTNKQTNRSQKFNLGFRNCIFRFRGKIKSQRRKWADLLMFVSCVLFFMTATPLAPPGREFEHAYGWSIVDVRQSRKAGSVRIALPQ